MKRRCLDVTSRSFGLIDSQTKIGTGARHTESAHTDPSDGREGCSPGDIRNREITTIKFRRPGVPERPCRLDISPYFWPWLGWSPWFSFLALREFEWVKTRP